MFWCNWKIGSIYTSVAVHWKNILNISEHIFKKLFSWLFQDYLQDSLNYKYTVIYCYIIYLVQPFGGILEPDQPTSKHLFYFVKIPFSLFPIKLKMFHVIYAELEKMFEYYWKILFKRTDRVIARYPLCRSSQCPINNGTLETCIWSIMWKILSF